MIGNDNAFPAQPVRLCNEKYFNISIGFVMNYVPCMQESDDGQGAERLVLEGEATLVLGTEEHRVPEALNYRFQKPERLGCSISVASSKSRSYARIGICVDRKRRRHNRYDRCCQRRVRGQTR